MPTVIKPPTPTASFISTPSIFLAGSIEMDKAEDWQSRLTASLSDLDLVIFNPRRDA
ncbi:MAG: nucleoside 2-deoxyribosyltransferase domain-containing protein, partial [Chloroflexota bacterium]